MIRIIYLIVLLGASLLANAQTAKSQASATKENCRTSKNSVAISDSDGSYSLNAHYDRPVYEELKQLLSENLENKYMSASGPSVLWEKKEKGETVYSFALTESKVRISIDKEKISESAFGKFKALGEKISALISGK